MKTAVVTRCAVAALLGLLAVLTVAPVHADAYLDELEIQKSNLNGFIAILKGEISAHGDASVKSAEAKTEFVVSPQRVVNAWVARVDPGRYQVQITPTFRLLATYVTDVDVVASTDVSILDCRMDYIALLYRYLGSVSVNGSDTQIPSPGGFFARDSKCASYAGRFPIPPQYKFGRDQVVNVIVELAYLHELGHVALQHPAVDLTALPKVPTSDSLRQFRILMRRSQAQETEADLWGVARFVSMTPNPYVMVNNAEFNFFMAFGGADCSAQPGQDHPNGFQRYSHMVDYMSTVASQQHIGPANPEMPSIIQDMTKLADKAQTKMHCSG